MFELHIEQGPVLEAEACEIGIVTGVQGLRWFEARLTGRAAHTGSTPMAMRKNALLGAARVIEAVDAIGQAKPATPATPRTVVASMAPVAAPPAAANDIVIRTRGESWITVTGIDGGNLEQGLVPADSERRYAAAQVARLTIGNASAVDVENHGRNVDMGSSARANVARFTVSSDGSLVAAD